MNRRVPLAVLALMAASACGSTVSLVNGQSASTTGLDGLQVAGPTNAGALPTAGTDSGGSGTASGDGTGTTPGSSATGATAAVGTSGGGGTSSTPGDATAGAGVSVPGVTAKTVKLGVEYINAAALNAFATGAGANGTGKIDGLSAFEAAVAAVNRAGGAGGRTIQLVPYQRSVSDSNAQVAQAECAAWTQDNRVFAATASFTEDSPIVDCLSKRGVLSIAGSLIEAGSQHDFQRYAGRYVAPGVADTITASRAYVNALVRQGFLTSKHKTGLLWFDFADFKAARAEGLLPALKAAGIPLTDQFEASYDGNPSDLGAIATAMQSASLRFRSEGIDRVITLDYNGTLEYFFMTVSQQQGYQPKYGLASWTDAEFLRGNEPAKQLEGATGIGWLSGEDLKVSQQPTSSARSRCAAAMKAGNLPPPSAQTDVLVELGACATVFYLADLLNSTHDLSSAALVKAEGALGTRPSYTGFSETYAPDKLWGAATYRDLSYGVGCGCFSYTGPERSF